jgi:hypothetical protein
MREETVTNRKAKMAMHVDAVNRKVRAPPPPKSPGVKVRRSKIKISPPRTMAAGRSLSVLEGRRIWT